MCLDEVSPSNKFKGVSFSWRRIERSVTVMNVALSQHLQIAIKVKIFVLLRTPLRVPDDDNLFVSF